MAGGYFSNLHGVKMKRLIKLWGSRSFAVVLVVFAVHQWGAPLYKQYFTPKKASVFVPTTKTKEGKFVISFHETGSLAAERSVVVICETNGKVIDLVEDGKMVNAGDKIAELDTSEIMNQVRNQQMSYQNALADVDRAKADLDILIESDKTEVKQAEAQLDFEKSEHERAVKQLEKKKGLAADKLIPREQVDQAELEVNSKELAVTKDEMALSLKKKEIASKEQQKQADVSKVIFASSIQKQLLDSAQSRVNQGTITAPASGLVVISDTWSPDGHRKIQEGDNLNMQQDICSLPDLSSMLVKVQVGESDAPKVKIGIPVLIKLEAIPNKIYHGTVKNIATLATEQSFWESGANGRKNFEVTISVKESNPKILKPGMTADVEFICESLKKAVYVPMECVTERSGKTYVYIKQGNKYMRTEVKTGKHNDNFICITKGLKKGQIITLRDPTKSPDEVDTGSSTVGNNDKEDKKQSAPLPEPAKKKS